MDGEGSGRKGIVDGEGSERRGEWTERGLDGELGIVEGEV